jgi:hypothetical protein
MKLLLDTHVFLWAIAEPLSCLGAPARRSPTAGTINLFSASAASGSREFYGLEPLATAGGEGERVRHAAVFLAPGIEIAVVPLRPETAGTNYLRVWSLATGSRRGRAADRIRANRRAPAHRDFTIDLDLTMKGIRGGLEPNGHGYYSCGRSVERLVISRQVS